jgi:hypothetical protein
VFIELSLLVVYVWYVYILSRRLYIYILVFCGDPCFYSRAHPTPGDAVGREV